MTHLNINHLRSVAAGVALVAAASAMAFSPTYYHSESVLNDGHWVKVKVTNNGIHQFTYDQLREMGFSDPSKVTVYGYGGTLLTHQQFKSTDPDDLPPATSIHTNDGRIVFYGEGASRATFAYNSYLRYNIRTNYYANAGYYFLTDSRPLNDLKRVNRNMTTTADVTTNEVIEFVDFNEENVGQGGARFFSRDLKTNGNKPLQFDLVAPVPNSSDGYVAYSSVARSANVAPQFQAKLDEDITLDLGRNNSGIIQASTQNLWLFSRVYGYQFFNTRDADGATLYNVTVGPNASTSASPGYTYGANDWVFFSYPSRNTLAGRNQRILNFSGVLSKHCIIIDASNVEKFDERMKVWDITDPSNVRQFVTFASQNYQNLQLTPDRNYNTTDYPALRTIVFDLNQQFDTPEVVATVANQNIHSLPTPHMLIITNNACYNAAQRLAQAHRDIQGIDVVVLNQEEIFNEFSSGTPDGMAYRRVAKMFYDRDPNKFRSLLLFGHGIYDNRQIKFHSPDALLTYQTDDYNYMSSTATNFCSDDYFGYLDDYFTTYNMVSTKMNIAVGRIPAQNRDIDIVTDKIISRLSERPTQPYRNRVLAFADDNDENKHEKQAETVIASMKSKAPTMTFTKVLNNVYPWVGKDAYEARRQLIKSLNQGVDYVMYVGHGGAATLTLDNNNMWTKKEAQNETYTHIPIWMLATCDSYAFDRLSDGIAERMLYNPDGGAIAVVGAGRTVYADSNHYMNLAMGNVFAQATGATTLGQIYLDAHNQVMENPDINVHINTMAYNFLGDPEVPYLAPTLNVEVTRINGEPTSDETTLYPVSDNNVVGEIIDENGLLQSDFNGTVTLAVYDAPITITSTPKDGNSKPRDVVLDEDLLSQTTAPVVNGKFTAQVVIPYGARPDKSNRITLFAVNADATCTAVGLCSNSILTAEKSDETAIVDVTPPEIQDMYLDQPTFVDGDEVGQTTTLYVDILADPSGFNMSSATIGSSLSLTLDNQKSYSSIGSALSINADGSASVQFPISGLEEGRHQLTFGIADNLGNRSQRSISFVVVNRATTATLTVDSDYHREQATFDIEHAFTSAPSGRLIIQNSHGQNVLSIDNCTFPYTLDLVNDPQASKLADGHYRCFSILSDGKNYSNTNIVNLVIVK